MARGIGTSMGGGTESSPDRKRRRQEQLRRQEKQWAKRSGPVSVRFVDPDELKRGEPVELGAPEPARRPRRRAGGRATT